MRTINTTHHHIQKTRSKIVFVCITEFHLLISFILSVVYYSDFEKVLVCTKTSRVTPFKDKFSLVFDKVIFVTSEDNRAKAIAPIKNILHSISTVHFFSFGDYGVNHLIDYLFNQNKKIIFTDEGVASYDPFKRWPQLSKTFKPLQQLIIKNCLKSYSETWLLNPYLFLGSNKIKLKQISIIKFLKTLKQESIYKKFIDFFFLSQLPLIDSQIIFFNQNVFQHENFNTNFFDETVISLIGTNHYTYKVHPSNNADTDNSSDILAFQKAPWLAFLILNKIQNNSNKFPKIFISIGSSTMFNTCNLNFKGDYIFLNKIAQMYISKPDKYINRLIAQAKKIFINQHIYQPKSWAQLYDTLLMIYRKHDLNAPIISKKDILTSELEWLRKNLLSSNKKNPTVGPSTESSYLQQQMAAIQAELDSIKSSKFFRLWVVFNKFKNIFKK